MLARHVDWCCQIVHHLPRITLVGLQQERFDVGATAGSGMVVENSLGAIIDQVGIVVASQGSGELLVMRRKVAVIVDRARIRELRDCGKYALLQHGQDTVGERIEPGGMLLWIGVRNRLVAAVEQQPHG